MTVTSYFHGLISMWVLAGVVLLIYAIVRISFLEKNDISKAFSERKQLVDTKWNSLLFVFLSIYAILPILILDKPLELYFTNVLLLFYLLTIEIFVCIYFKNIKKIKVTKLFISVNLIIKISYYFPIFFASKNDLFFIPLFCGIHLMFFSLLVAKNKSQS